MSYKLSDSVVLAKNISLNIFTQVFLLIVSIVSIPVLIRQIGDEKFSIVLMSWTIIGYFNSLDLGVGRAVSHYVSKYLAIGEKQKVYGSIWVGLLISLIWGFTIIIFTFFFSKATASLIFQVTTVNYSEIENIIKLTTYGAPFVLMQSVLRAYLMSFQRFDYVNVVQGVSAVVQWISSLIVSYLSSSITLIITITIFIRILTTLYLFIYVWLISSDIFEYFSVDKTLAVDIVRFGIWIGISQVISFMLIYSDRFFISSMLSTKMVVYFIIPSEIVNRILYLIPGSFGLVLFPAFTERITLDINKAYVLYKHSLKYMFVLMLPLIFLLFFLSEKILELWVGVEFAYHSAFAFKVLLIGLIFSSISQIPLTIIQSLGRPDVITKFQLLQLPIYVLMCVLFIPEFGINGAAFAYLGRVLIETVLSFYYSRKIFKGFDSAILPFSQTIYLSGVLLLLDLGISYLYLNIFISAIIYLFISFAFWFLSYRLIFDEEDRIFIARVLDILIKKLLVR